MGSATSRFGPKVVVQRRRVAWPLACALVTAACGVIVLALGLRDLRDGFAHSEGVRLLVGLSALVVGKLAAAVLWVVKPTAGREVRVEAEGGRLLVAGVAVLASGAVTSAARDGSWRVDVYDGARQPAAVFLVPSSSDAAALAAAATPAVADGPVTFYLPFYQSKVGTWISVADVVASCIGLGLIGKSPWAWLAVVVSLACALLLLVPLRLTLGRDAIRFAWLHFRKYVALADVAEASVRQGKVVIRLRSGSQFLLGVRDEGLGRMESSPAAVVARIARTLDSSLEVDGAEALVAEGGRSRPAWRDALLELRAQGYRHPSLTPARLWSMLEHPRSIASARIGAAYLLADTLDDEGKARLQRFVLGCVDPRLRRELEVVVSTGSLA